MNRRKFLTLAASTAVIAALPAQAAMTQEDALRIARSKWGRYAVVSLKTGAEARAANRPGGEYLVGWKGYKGSTYGYGDSWKEAFRSIDALLKSYDRYTGRPIVENVPGPNS